MNKKTQTTHHRHALDHRDIDPNALSIVDALQGRGHTAYLVGGCVRDLLLGKHPKDFDIATTAFPQQVRRVISNAFIIGKRFRLVLVKRGEVQYEVATFRREARPDENTDNLPDGDNIFGTPEQDAQRRDFTINSLMYDPYHRELIDYANGLEDLNHGVIRMIGDPNVRLIEDPIRILRGIRLAHMIHFKLDAELRTAITVHAGELANTALPRRREELLKFLRLDDPSLAFLTTYDLGALKFVSPTLNEVLSHPEKSEVFVHYLAAFHDQKLTTPAELFAGLVLAFHLTMTGGELHDDMRAHDILEHETLGPMMRDEFGMFKSEQLVFAKALHLLHLLKRREEFEKRGARRRLALVNTEAFPLALLLAERIQWLSANDLHYWQSEARNTRRSGSDARGPGGGGAGNKRRRRRKPRGPKPSNAASGDQAGGDTSNTSKSES